jgi:solute carrier family 35 protein C2
MTISAAAIIFHDPLTPVNISGLLVTIISIAGYNYIKISKMRQEALEQTYLAHHPHNGGGGSGVADNTTGYAAVVGDESEDDDNSSSHHQRISSGILSHRDHE